MEDLNPEISAPASVHSFMNQPKIHGPGEDQAGIEKDAGHDADDPQPAVRPEGGQRDEALPTAPAADNGQRAETSHEGKGAPEARIAANGDGSSPAEHPEQQRESAVEGTAITEDRVLPSDQPANPEYSGQAEDTGEPDTTHDGTVGTIGHAASADTVKMTTIGAIERDDPFLNDVSPVARDAGTAKGPDYWEEDHIKEPNVAPTGQPEDGEGPPYNFSKGNLRIQNIGDGDNEVKTGEEHDGAGEGPNDESGDNRDVTYGVVYEQPEPTGTEQHISESGTVGQAADLSDPQAVAIEPARLEDGLIDSGADRTAAPARPDLTRSDQSETEQALDKPVQPQTPKAERKDPLTDARASFDNMNDALAALTAYVARNPDSVYAQNGSTDAHLEQLHHRTAESCKAASIHIATAVAGLAVIAEEHMNAEWVNSMIRPEEDGSYERLDNETFIQITAMPAGTISEMVGTESYDGKFGFYFTNGNDGAGLIEVEGEFRPYQNDPVSETRQVMWHRFPRPANWPELQNQHEMVVAITQTAPNINTPWSTQLPNRVTSKFRFQSAGADLIWNGLVHEITDKLGKPVPDEMANATRMRLIASGLNGKRLDPENPTAEVMLKSFSVQHGLLGSLLVEENPQFVADVDDDSEPQTAGNDIDDTNDRLPSRLPALVSAEPHEIMAAQRGLFAAVASEARGRVAIFHKILGL